MTTTTTAPAKTTIAITWTDAPTVRIKANRDFPEYGVSKGETVYLVAVTGKPGVYYIVRFVATAWSCPCEGNAKFHRTCKHIKMSSKHCKVVADRRVTLPAVLASKQLTAFAASIPAASSSKRDRATAPLQARAFPGLPPTWDELAKRRQSA